MPGEEIIINYVYAVFTTMLYFQVEAVSLSLSSEPPIINKK